VSVALVIYHAIRMRCIILTSEACLAVPYLSTISHKRYGFRENVTEHKMCVLIFSTILSQIFLVLRRIQRDIIINLNRSSCTVPVVLARLQRNLKFFDRLSGNTEIRNFKEIRQVGAELFHMDGETDVMKLVVTFLSFTNAPKEICINIKLS